MLISRFVLLLLFMLIQFFDNSTAISISITQSAFDIDNNNSEVVHLPGRLVFAHVIFRHGDRTPIMSYPTDPWNNIKDWPAGWGQLTNTGKQQQYLLGQWLRKRYDELLGTTYSEDKIYILATDVDRTLMSALSNLAGLYPPTDKEKWNEALNWQPIPVHTIPENLDSILAAAAPCPAYDYASSMLMKSSEFQDLQQRYAALYEYLSNHTGMKVETFQDILLINDTLRVESLYGKKLPEWTNAIFPSQDMSYLSKLFYVFQTYTRQMARLKTGPLIKEILQRFDEKARGKLVPDRSVWLYSAHDTTIVNVLYTLKVNEFVFPEYDGCILLELRIDENHQPFVLVFYKSSLAAEPKLLELPGCEIACPLNKMFSLYEDILPIDWNAECQVLPTM